MDGASVAIQPMPIATSVRVAGAAPSSARLRYRLDVLGTDAADVVHSAGGWLFDRAMAGWAVDVWLADVRDARALHILGTRVHPLAERMRPAADNGVVATLAVAGGLVGDDRSVGAEIADAVRAGHAEVVLWGSPWPELLGGRSGSVRYGLSAAARTFKRHALAAAGSGDITVAPTEALICGGHRPSGSDLAAAGG